MILADIYLVSGGSFGLGHFADCNVYLVECGGALALIDSGAGIDTRNLIANVRSHGFNEASITHIINTHYHFDHTGGDKKIRDLSDCKICIHENGAEALERGDPQKTAVSREIKFQTVRVDRRLGDNDRLQIGNREFEILHTPGHSSDSICILMKHPQGKALFSGDTAFAFGQPGVLSIRSDMPAYYRSIERISGLDIDILLPGHGIFTLSDASEQIDHLLLKLSEPWSDFILHPPHPFWPMATIKRKLMGSSVQQ